MAQMMQLASSGPPRPRRHVDVAVVAGGDGGVPGVETLECIRKTRNCLIFA
jgi:hypothetical protein